MLTKHAVWASDENRILLYVSKGERFGEIQLSESSDPGKLQRRARGSLPFRPTSILWHLKASSARNAPLAQLRDDLVGHGIEPAVTLPVDDIVEQLPLRLVAVIEVVYAKSKQANRYLGTFRALDSSPGKFNSHRFGQAAGSATELDHSRLRRKITQMGLESISPLQPFYHQPGAAALLRRRKGEDGVPAVV